MVHPAVPLGWDIRSIVVVTILVWEDHPSIAQIHVVIVLVVLVAEFILTHQFAMLDLVVANELEKCALNATVVIDNLASIGPNLAHGPNLLSDERHPHVEVEGSDTRKKAGMTGSQDNARPL